MALTPSTMLPLGTAAPDFELPDVVSGKKISLSSFKDKKAILVMFICRHCPYVEHVKHELARLGKDYVPQGVGVVAISSNDAKNYPDDSPAKLKEMALELGFNFPFCYDETQAVAKKYAAACTPDFFLFAAPYGRGVASPPQLAYRGQLDDSRPGNNKPLNGKDLRSAIDAVLAGRPVTGTQRPSIGCNIKWKPGNEPTY
ncbi:MAG: thioredoxin family protein [Candidatus Omnitrophica bacterium]|nr:thioredoxin family protein [Candidatus Omnitrophota bacterium]